MNITPPPLPAEYLEKQAILKRRRQKALRLKTVFQYKMMMRTLIFMGLMVVAGCVSSLDPQFVSRDAVVLHMKQVMIPKIEWHQKPMSEVLLFLQASSGTRNDGTSFIPIQYRGMIGIDGTEITFISTNTNISLYSALETVLKVTDMRWEYQDGGVIIKDRYSKKKIDLKQRQIIE